MAGQCVVNKKFLKSRSERKPDISISMIIIICASVIDLTLKLTSLNIQIHNKKSNICDDNK